MSAAGNHSDGARQGQEALIEKIVEELWQNGYTLNRVDGEWIVKEPLGRKDIRLSSDAELLRFASDRVKTKIPNQAIDEAPSSTPPPPAQEIQADSRPESEGAGRKVWPGWMRRTVFYTLSGIVAGSLILSVWMPADHPQQSSPPPASLPVPAASGKAPVADHGAPGEIQRTAPPGDGATPAPALPFNEGMTGKTGEMAGKAPLQAVAPSKHPSDLSSASDRCIAQLTEKYGARNIMLLRSERRLQIETCYSIHGKEHCPYLSNGHAIFNYAETGSTAARVYACDINVAAESVGNLRVVQTNPDIVRFLMKEAASEQ